MISNRSISTGVILTFSYPSLQNHIKLYLCYQSTVHIFLRGGGVAISISMVKFMVLRLRQTSLNWNQFHQPTPPSHMRPKDQLLLGVFVYRLHQWGRFKVDLGTPLSPFIPIISTLNHSICHKYISKTPVHSLVSTLAINIYGNWNIFQCLCFYLMLVRGNITINKTKRSKLYVWFHTF